MTVKELIEKLKEVDQELPVVICIEHDFYEVTKAVVLESVTIAKGTYFTKAVKFPKAVEIW